MAVCAVIEGAAAGAIVSCSTNGLIRFRRVRSASASSASRSKAADRIGMEVLTTVHGFPNQALLRRAEGPRLHAVDDDRWATPRPDASCCPPATTRHPTLRPARDQTGRVLLSSRGERILSDDLRWRAGRRLGGVQ